MAAKITQNMGKYCYKTYIQSLNERDAFTLDDFKDTRFSNYFVVDLSHTYKNDKANANFVFEQFGSFNDKFICVVRQALLQDVATDINFYQG